MSAPDEPRIGSGAPPDDREIEAIVAAYAGVISRAVRRVAADRAPAIEDDVQQAVMVAIWRQLQRGQTIAHPASYIFRAAIRETLRLVRREHAPMAAQGADPEQTSDTSPAGDPHRHLEEKDRRRAMLDAIASLDPKRQQAVRAHLSGFDVREMMEMYGWSYQTARHLIARGMVDLRRRLRERGMHE